MAAIKAEELYIPVSKRARKVAAWFWRAAAVLAVGSVIEPWATHIFSSQFDPAASQPWTTLSSYLGDVLTRPRIAWTAGTAFGCVLAFVAGKWLVDHDRLNATKLMRPAQTLAEIQIRFPDSPVTAIPHGGKGESLSQTLERASVKEALHSLRTVLRRTAGSAGPRKLLITSSGPGEGKTTVALGLARSLSASGDRVLLVDADLRKYRLTRAVGEPVGLGLSDVLTAEFDRLWLRRLFGPTGPSVLLAGTTPDDSATFLDRLERTGMWDKIAEGNDWVIIDGPPVLGLADAPTLARGADVVIFIIEAGETLLSAVVGAIDRLALQSANLILTLSKTTRMWSEFSFGLAPESFYGYGYGYTYGDDPDYRRERARAEWGTPIPLDQLNSANVARRAFAEVTSSKWLLASIVAVALLMGLTFGLLAMSSALGIAVAAGVLLLAFGTILFLFASHIRQFSLDEASVDAAKLEPSATGELSDEGPRGR